MRKDQAALDNMADSSTRMLYEFYTTQTTKCPSSVNATYLLEGVPKSLKASLIDGYQQDGEDVHMQSSPYMSSSVLHQEDQEAAPSRSIVLAKEEDLEGKMVLRFVGYAYPTVA